MVWWCLALSLRSTKASGPESWLVHIFLGTPASSKDMLVVAGHTVRANVSINVCLSPSVSTD